MHTIWVWFNGNDDDKIVGIVVQNRFSPDFDLEKTNRPKNATRVAYIQNLRSNTGVHVVTYNIIDGCLEYVG